MGIISNIGKAVSKVFSKPAPKPTPTPQPQSTPAPKTSTPTYFGPAPKNNPFAGGGTYIGQGGQGTSVAPPRSSGGGGGGGSSGGGSSSSPAPQSVSPTPQQPTQTYNPATDVIQSKPNPFAPQPVSNALTTAIQQRRQQSVIESTKPPTTNQPYISRAKDYSRQRAISNVRSSIGYEGDKPATVNDLAQAYRATGNEKYNPKNYYVASGVGYKLKVSPNNIPTRLELKLEVTRTKEAPIKEEVGKIRTEVLSSAKQSEGEIRQQTIVDRDRQIEINQAEIQRNLEEGKYGTGQQAVDRANKILEGNVRNIDEIAQDRYNRKIEQLNLKSNKEFETKLSESQTLKEKQKDYDKAVKLLGGKAEGQRITYESLNRPLLDTRTTGERLTEAKEGAIQFTPIIGSLARISEFEREQKIKDASYKIATGIATGTPQERKETSGEVLTRGLLAGGLALDVASIGIINAKALIGPANEEAMLALRQQVKAGEYQLPSSSFKTGKIDITYKDIWSATKTDTFDIGTKQVSKLATQINKQKEYLKNLGLADYKKVYTETTGTINEQKLIGDVIGLDKDVTNIKNLEVGKFYGTKASGKQEVGYIAKATQTTEKGSKSVQYVFKLNKDGSIKSVRRAIVIPETEEGFSKVLFQRPSFPKELTKTKFNIADNTDQVIVEEIDRFTTTKVGKALSRTSTSQIDEANKILRTSKTEGVVAQVGGKLKGTMADIDAFAGVDKQLNIVYKPTKAKPLSKFVSVRKEIVNKPTDVVQDFSDDIIKATKKIGEQSKGLSFEVSKGELIDEPIKFSKVSGKADEVLKMYNKIDDKPLFPKNIDVKQFDVTTPKYNVELPSYVGGKGGVSSQSMYSYTPEMLDFNYKSADSDITLNLLNMYNKAPPTINLKAIEKVTTISPNNIGGISSNVLIPSFDEQYKKENLKFDTNFEAGKSKLIFDDALKLIKKNDNLIFPASVYKPSSRTGTLPKTETITIPKMKLDTKQVAVSMNQLVAPQVPKYDFAFDPTRIPPIDPFGFGFPRGSSGSGSQRINNQMRKLTKMNSKYTASLGSAFAQAKPYKVTKKQYKELNKRMFSGAEARPVLEIVDDKEMAKLKKKIYAVEI